MNIVEIHSCTEVLVSWSCKEVQTAISAKNVTGLFHNCSNRCIAENIIVACATGDSDQFCNRIFQFTCVYKMKFNTFLLICLNREQLFCTIQTILIQICNNNHGRAYITMQRIGQCTKSHRTCTRHNGQLAVFLDAHLMCINTHLCMISCVESTNTAGHRLCQGSLIVSTAFVL